MRYLIIAVFAGVLTAPVNAQSTDTPDLLAGEAVLRVQADGFVERMPDTLGITIQIRSEGSSPTEVARVNSAKLQRLIADLRALGIHEGWVGAEDFEANPIYAERADGRDDRSKVIGYAANQQLSIELPDLNRFQAVLGRLAQEGYSELRANFGLKDRPAAQLAAQRVAIANARAEGENMASALGKRVSRLLLIANERLGYQGWEELGDSITVTGSRVQPLELKPTPVRVESTVYVDWSLVDK